MALFSKKNLNTNPFGLTEEDLKGNLKGFPMGVVVRMMEETLSFRGESYAIPLSLNFLQKAADAGFSWMNSEAGYDFWWNVIYDKDFDLFFEKYPDYEMYNIS